MSRTSQAEVHAVFGRLCATVGVPEGVTFDPETSSFSHGWSLSYAACYGGWRVAGHSGTGTGESCPLGERRMTAGAFVAAMHMTIRGVEAARELMAGELVAATDAMRAAQLSGMDTRQRLARTQSLLEDVTARCD